ncbi:MAG: glycosyltransferase [Candidatus Saccharibacteria bacterium]|nr:glycosyltransferase [Candidatus Saccharibacteria bacterium]
MNKTARRFPKWLNSELVFYLGVALLPFENFFFAPSAGWATVTPLFFALYLLFNLKLTFRHLVKQRKIFIFFILAAILGTFTAFCYNVNLKDYVNAFVPLALGAVSLLTFSLYYSKKRDLKTVINIIVISYALCAVVGIFEHLAVKLGNQSFANWLSSFFKRDYLVSNSRVQFFFTEPSFVGMHLFGILLPLYWISRRKDLLFIMVLLTVESIGFGVGVRVIVDIAVVAILYFTFLILKHGKAKFIPLILLVLGLSFNYFYTNNFRVQQIVDNGIYADGSLATRYFRSQASFIGYRNTFPKVLLGFGLGNSMYPLRSGYDEAIEQYKSDYLKEVNDIGELNFHDDAASYSLYTRFISEFGLIFTIVAILYLVYLTDKSSLPQKWLYLSVVLYIYVQFESLGFYALWLFIVIMQETKGDLSFFERRRLKNRVKKDSKKHILVFGITDKSGGVESVIMNYFRNIDREKFQFDFLCNTEKVAYKSEIEKLGGKIYQIPARSKDLKAYKKALKSFFKEHGEKYDIFWMNVCSLANVDYLKEAKRAGIPRRIIHAHNSKNMDSRLRGILHLINRTTIDDLATDFWTCSDSSSSWFYPEIDLKKIKKINNSIDLEKFKYNEKAREEIRKELKVSKDQKIILNVGRLNFQKNQQFILKLAEENNPKYTFLLVGTGEDEKILKNRLKDLKADVRLLGERSDIPKLLSGADLFLFPSIFEGSPVALFEAEANGIPTVASKESYTEERKLSSSIKLISLEKPAEKWLSLISETLTKNQDREKLCLDNLKELEKNELGIKNEAKKVEKEFLR